VASLGHVAVGVAAARAFGEKNLGRRMLLFGALSLLPDADVLGWAAGVPYGSSFGHRGASHSLVAALLVAAIAFSLVRYRRHADAGKTLLFVLLVVGSHGLLDALTDGGKGVALFWPFTPTRYFFPWRPIPVAPIGVRVLSPRGMQAMLFELRAFAPCWLYAFWPRRGKNRTP
jgi:inner membrane protein